MMFPAKRIVSTLKERKHSDVVKKLSKANVPGSLIMASILGEEETPQSWNKTNPYAKTAHARSWNK